MRSVLTFGAVLAALLVGYTAGSAKTGSAAGSSTAVTAVQRADPAPQAQQVEVAEAAADVTAPKTAATEDEEAPTPRKAVGVCVTCHGLDGIAKIPIAPHLAGESRVYLETQLKAFRNGKREHEMMSVVAKEMSDAEISAAATWYSAIKIKAEMPE